MDHVRLLLYKKVKTALCHNHSDLRSKQSSSPVQMKGKTFPHHALSEHVGEPRVALRCAVNHCVK